MSKAGACRKDTSMIKLEMKLNDSLIQANASHTPAEIYDAIDKVFAKYNFKKTSSPDGTVSYSGTGAASDYGAFANLILFLKKKDWFMPYLEKWLWYNSDDGKTEDDFAVEDILLHYANKRSVS